MFNPWVYFLRFQQSAFEGMANMTQVVMDGYVKVIRQQQDAMARHLDHRRAEDNHTRPKVIPSGPDLQDHYGRRSHDIDVEHDV